MVRRPSTREDRPMTKTPFNYEIPNEMRDVAEKSVDQAKKAGGGVMSAANKAVSAVETHTDSVQANSKEMAKKAITYAEQNVSAAFDLAEKIVRSRDVQEVMQHQADFLKTQMSALQSQMQEFGAALQSTVQKAATEAQATMQKAASEVQKAASEATKR